MSNFTEVLARLNEGSESKEFNALSKEQQDKLLKAYEPIYIGGNGDAGYNEFKALCKSFGIREITAAATHIRSLLVKADQKKKKKDLATAYPKK
jgi:Ca2+-binding EF-hand superfamily protein